MKSTKCGNALTVGSWLLASAAGLSCGRTNLDSLGEQQAGTPPAQTSGGAAPSSVAGGGPTTGGGLAMGGTTGRVAHEECGALIDDMEDGSGRICTGMGRVGVWYAFSAPLSQQWPPARPPGKPIETSLFPTSRGASRRGMHTYGKAVGWGAGIGVDLHFDGTTYGTYDAARYQGVHFWARGSAGARGLRVRISTSSTTTPQFGGSCDPETLACKVGPAGVYLTLESEWHDYTVSFAELEHVNERDRLTNIQFMVDGDFDFWIDDVSFVEGPLSCCPDLPDCRGGVRLTDAALHGVLVDHPAAPLDCGDVCALHSLTLADPAIQSLEGLQCLGALEQLSIETSSVSDLTPLAGLRGLRELRVDHSRVNLLQPLRGLTNLNKLSLAHDELGDVYWLQSLTHLQSLDVSDNSIGDITPLEHLTALESLALGTNQISDASPVSQLAKLKTLDLSNNRVDYLGEHASLPALVELNLTNNRLTDVGALADLSSLYRLYLDHNQISDASPLAGLTQLAELDLSSNSIQVLNGPFAFRGLKLLGLASNGLRLVPESALAGSVLTRVALANNALTELNAFEHVHFASTTDGSEGRNFGGGVIQAELDVSNNQVRALEPLLRAGFQNLTILAADNPIDCALEASTIQSLRAKNDSVDVCP